jgi:chitinase
MALVRRKKPRDPIPPSVEPPPRELSPLRVLILILALAALVFGGWKLFDRETPATAAKSDAIPVYAPYVDVTLTPTYPFQLPSANPVSSVYLAFIVSDSSEPCTPSWGDYYTLDQAGKGLDLDARTAQLRDQGGSLMISFGGRDNGELAVGCTSPAELRDAYLAPVVRYHAAAIDLDLEGATLSDRAANARRAKAIAAVQKQLAGDDKPLAVWVTLPVSAAGLTAEGEAAVRSLLNAGVKLAGVNAMAMDFGTDEAAEDMLGTVEASLTATHAQVQSLWRAAGLESGAAAAWGHVGATVMIGVNDITDERFTTRDARALAAFIDKVGIPRVSVWSLNRDSQCGGAFARTGILSNTCSGVVQKPLQFTQTFSELRGTKTARRETAAPRVPAEATKVKHDDPAKSPYPIWRASAAYEAGYKIVWQGQIYQASWWNQGTPPGSAAANSPNGPWQPIGPVPAGSQAPELMMRVEGSFPHWSPTAVYHQGDRVDFDDLPYQARWYTKGEQPISSLPADPSAPWEPLFNYPGEPTPAEPTEPVR